MSDDLRGKIEEVIGKNPLASEDDEFSVWPTSDGNIEFEYVSRQYSPDAYFEFNDATLEELHYAFQAENLTRLVVHVNEEDSEVTRLEVSVNENFRGQGYGTSLVNLGEKIAETYGATEIRTIIDIDSRVFAEKMGYETFYFRGGNITRADMKRFSGTELIPYPLEATYVAVKEL